MISPIEVIQSDGDLRRKVWRFSLIRDNELTLTYFFLETRKSNRHKWKTQGYYNAYDHRGSDMVITSIPPEVSEKAKENLFAQIVVKTFDR